MTTRTGRDKTGSRFLRLGGEIAVPKIGNGQDPNEPGGIRQLVDVDEISGIAYSKIRRRSALVTTR